MVFLKLVRYLIANFIQSLFKLGFWGRIANSSHSKIVLLNNKNISFSKNRLTVTILHVKFDILLSCLSKKEVLACYDDSPRKSNPGDLSIANSQS